MSHFENQVSLPCDIAAGPSHAPTHERIFPFGGGPFALAGHSGEAPSSIRREALLATPDTRRITGCSSNQPFEEDKSEDALFDPFQFWTGFSAAETQGPRELSTSPVNRRDRNSKRTTSEPMNRVDSKQGQLHACC